MSIAKVIEISASSTQGFEDAISTGIARASETIHGIEGAWVKEQKVVIVDNRVTDYRVSLAITFKVD
ncbi:MAG TPA: dodecin family protein [Acidimicrobiales bacterium]|nr:dodecin family protein [Acidimicrobiales bacterium]